MEHLYQPEEIVFNRNYSTFKDYYTSPHHPPFSPQQVKAVPSLYQLVSSSSSSSSESIGGSDNDGVHPILLGNNASIGAPGIFRQEDSSYFYLSWNVVHLTSQQPHCVWPLFHLAYCLLLFLGHSIQRRVFGNLRASEKENIKEQFWNLVFYKVVFVFGVVNVQDIEDAVGWCFFVFFIGLLQLARQLCQERHNYLILMNDWSRRGQCRRHRILGLLSFIFVSSIFLFMGVGSYYFCTTPSSSSSIPSNTQPGLLFPTNHPHNEQPGSSSPQTFNLSLHSVIFMLCELGLLVIQTLHVLIICIFEQVRAKWYKGRQISDETYTNLSHSINFKFDLISLLFDLVHHVHMLVCCNLFLSMTSLVVSLQMRNRVRKIHRVLKKRQCYLWLTEHIDHYPDAIFDSTEVNKSGEDEEKCAICWDSLSSQKAKCLPCHHIFHTPCLRQWLIVSMNCPACRHSLLNEKDEAQYNRPVERTTRRLYAPRPIGVWGFLQTGQALLDLFGGWDPQYDDSYDEPDSPPSTPDPSTTPSASTTLPTTPSTSNPVPTPSPPADGTATTNAKKKN